RSARHDQSGLRWWGLEDPVLYHPDPTRCGQGEDSWHAGADPEKRAVMIPPCLLRKACGSTEVIRGDVSVPSCLGAGLHRPRPRGLAHARTDGTRAAVDSRASPSTDNRNECNKRGGFCSVRCERAESCQLPMQGLA